MARRHLAADFMQPAAHPALHGQQSDGGHNAQHNQQWILIEIRSQHCLTSIHLSGCASQASARPVLATSSRPSGGAANPEDSLVDVIGVSLGFAN